MGTLPERRYRALADIIVGGRLLFVKDRDFVTRSQIGEILVKQGRAVGPLADDPLPEKGRYKRRDMRPKDYGG